MILEEHHRKSMAKQPFRGRSGARERLAAPAEQGEGADGQLQTLDHDASTAWHGGVQAPVEAADVQGASEQVSGSESQAGALKIRWKLPI